MAKETDPAKIREIEIALGKLGKQADALRIAINNESGPNPDQRKIDAAVADLNRIGAEMTALQERLA